MLLCLGLEPKYNQGLDGIFREEKVRDPTPHDGQPEGSHASDMRGQERSPRGEVLVFPELPLAQPGPPAW